MELKKNKLIQKYKDSKYMKCPICGSKIVAIDQPEIDMYQCFQEIHCTDNSCPFECNDIYQLIDAEFIEN